MSISARVYKLSKDANCEFPGFPRSPILGGIPHKITGYPETSLVFP